MDMCRDSAAPTRRDLLKLGATAVAAGGVIAVTNLAAPGPAVAQTLKRGGVLRLAHQFDPVGLDPHQTISFATMIPLSFIYSRLMKVKAGPLVKPGTYPVETDLAGSWTHRRGRQVHVRAFPHHQGEWQQAGPRDAGPHRGRGPLYREVHPVRAL